MPTVLIGGGSGLIGTRLSQLLTEKGYQVWHLSRQADADATYPTYEWDVQRSVVDQAAIDGADYVINLAGAGIADKLWSEKRKKVIIDSRVNTTRLLRDAMQRAPRPPRAFLSASGIGYYGDRGEQVLHENDPAGSGFLPESCIAWENAVQQVADTGIRTAMVRTGIVLSTQGGALPKMSLSFKFFAGVYFGDGRQWYSWIHIDDLCRMYIHLLENEQLSGIFNGIAPQPVRNQELIAQAAEACGQKVIMLPAPAFALKLVLGEMSHTVLDSTRVAADKIQSTGFSFDFMTPQAALEDVFRREV